MNKTAASQYALVTSQGETATVNTAEESMTIDDYMSFVALNTTNDAGAGDNNDADELYYVREKPMTYTPAAASAAST